MCRELRIKEDVLKLHTHIVHGELEALKEEEKRLKKEHESAQKDMKMK